MSSHATEPNHYIKKVFLRVHDHFYLGSNTKLHDDIADPIKTLCGQTEISSPILKYKDIKIL